MGMILLLAGIGLIVFSVYVIYINVYPVVLWRKAKGLIVRQEPIYDSDEGVNYMHDVAIYTDNKGEKHEILAKMSNGKEDFNIPGEGEVSVYYNPANPEEAMIFAFKNFLGIVMAPFGVFLIFLGWAMQIESPDDF